MGCTDEQGAFHEINTEWTMATDSCQRCSCLGDKNLMCRAKPCALAEKPMCANGIEPSVVFDVEGCCPSYVCDCKLNYFLLQFFVDN